ncbi:MAG: AMIN-like domain-containing (lipo)protein [Candidatus Limnocylindrales bacterium]
MRRILAGLAAATLLFSLGACSAASSSPSASTSIGPSPSTTLPASPTAAPSGPSPSASPEPTDALAPLVCAFPLTRPASGTVPTHPIAIRLGQHPGYDRIVFQYLGDGVPALTIASVAPPFVRDPSGLPLTVTGSAFLQIKLEGVFMEYVGVVSFPVGFAILQDLERQGDFEGVQTWIAGLSGSACARVFSLTSPTRLVIDLGSPPA